MRLIDDRHHPEYPSGVKKSAEGIAEVISSKLPPGWGFALLTFQFGKGGTMGYISNSSREDMIKALREQADFLEGKPRG